MTMKILNLFIGLNLLKINLPNFNIPHLQFLSICKSKDWTKPPRWALRFNFFILTAVTPKNILPNEIQ